MLSHEELSKLSRDLQDRSVLSVYVDGDQNDPAQRRSWRTRLDNALSRVAQEVAGNGGDSGQFESARKRMEAALDQNSGFLHGKGWVAFVSADEVHEAGTVPFRVPMQVRWEDGPFLAPYFRGLRHHRPVTVAVADRRRARILKHQEGSLEELPALQAFTDLGDVTDSNVAKRAANRTGIRGATGKDLAQRFLQVEAERLHHEVVKQIQEHAGGGGLVILGGPSETASQLYGMLDKRLQERARVVSGLSMDASPSELRPLVTQAVRELSQDMQQALLDSVLEVSHQGGSARLGIRDVRKAVREGRADTLLLSERVLESEESDVADQLVDSALALGAKVEVLVGDAGARLDEAGEGMAARLRF